MKISRIDNARVNPHVSVDCVIFGFDDNQLEVLLIDRGDVLLNGKSAAPVHGSLALPGDLIYDIESLDEAARRVLSELTGLQDIYLRQFYAFGNPDRVKRNPEDEAWLKQMRDEPAARVLTIAYYALVKKRDYVPAASSFAKRADWYPVDGLPELAFDHDEILEKALSTLRGMLHTRPIGLQLLPEKFTLGELQKLYESILGSELDKRNFRKKILKKKLLIPLNEKQTGVPHKPAQYYKFDQERYFEMAEGGFELSFLDYSF